MNTTHDNMLFVGTSFPFAGKVGPTAEQVDAVQRQLELHEAQARQHASEVMTTMLQQFLSDVGYDGHQPTSYTLHVDSTEEHVALVHLHQTIDVSLVFVNSPTYGRTYGVIGANKLFKPMTLNDIRMEYGDVAVRHMATTLIMGKHLDDLAAAGLTE